MGAFQRSVFASCARGLGHPPCVTIRILWRMREHIVLSVCFGIVGSPLPSSLSFLASPQESPAAWVTTVGCVAVAKGSPSSCFS